MALSGPSAHTSRGASGVMKALEDLLEALNESDVGSDVESLTGSLSCLEGCETAADFRANLTDSIEAAQALLKSLRELQGEIQ